VWTPLYSPPYLLCVVAGVFRGRPDRNLTSPVAFRHSPTVPRRSRLYVPASALSVPKCLLYILLRVTCPSRVHIGTLLEVLCIVNTPLRSTAVGPIGPGLSSIHRAAESSGVLGNSRGVRGRLALSENRRLRPTWCIGSGVRVNCGHGRRGPAA
jgi:hypothetical protein